MYFGFFQFIGHGLQMNIKGKTLYNPGLLSVILLHIPIGIYYIYFVESHELVNGLDYIYGFVVFILATIITVVLPVQGLKDRNTPIS